MFIWVLIMSIILSLTKKTIAYSIRHISKSAHYSTTKLMGAPGNINKNVRQMRNKKAIKGITSATDSNKKSTNPENLLT